MGKQENMRVVDELLSGIAQGYTNEEYVADQIFPVVQTTMEKGKARLFAKEHFRYLNGKRGMGAGSNVIESQYGVPISWQLDEYDIGIPIDWREYGEARDINLRITRTYEVQEIMRLRREKDVADLIQTTGNYTSGNTAAIGTKWTAAGGDPIKDVDAAKSVVRGNIGRNPNTLLLGHSSYVAAKNNPQVIDRVKHSERGIITVDILKELFEVENLIIGKAVWVNDAGTQADVWGDNAILAYVAPGVRDQRSYRTPAFGYTLEKKGWAPIDSYFREGNKVEVIRGTALEAQLFHGQIAGYLMSDTNA